MNIHFFATLRQVVGQKTVEFDLPPEVTVSQLVDIIVSQYPDLRNMLLDEEGQLLGYVHVFINGRDAIYLEEGMATVVKTTDKVDIFPAIAGG